MNIAQLIRSYVTDTLFPNFIIINNTVMNILPCLSGKYVGTFTGHIYILVELLVHRGMHISNFSKWILPNCPHDDYTNLYSQRRYLRVLWCFSTSLPTSDIQTAKMLPTTLTDVNSILILTTDPNCWKILIPQHFYLLLLLTFYHFLVSC